MLDPDSTTSPVPSPLVWGQGLRRRFQHQAQAPSPTTSSPSTSSTPASPPGSSSATSPDRSPISRPSTQAVASSRTAPPASTSNAKDSRRYFNSRLRGVYAACTLPTRTASAASHTTLSSSYSSSTTRRSSWTQTMNSPPSRTSPTTSSLSSPFSALASTASGAAAAVANKRPKKAATPAVPTPMPLAEEDRKRKTPLPFQRKVAVEGHLRCFKVRMLPTPEQTRELKRAFSASRRAFNWALDRVKNHGEKPNTIALRNAYRKEAPPHWAVGKQAVASRIVAGGVKQLADAYASNFAKKKKDPSHTFEIKFRSTRRNPNEAIKIDKADAQGGQSPLNRFAPMPHPYPKQFAEQRRHGRTECRAFLGNNFSGVGGIVLQDKPRVIEHLLGEGNRLKEDAKILWDRRTGHFHFVYTFEQPKLADPDPTFASKRVLATDPGVRDFQTWYSPTSGAYGTLNEGFQQQIEPRIHALDELQSRVDRRYDVHRDAKGKVTSKTLKPPAPNRTKKQYYATSRRLKRKLARDRRRHVGWIGSAHYDAANFVLRDHDVIVQPWLHSAALTQRSTRVIRSKVARNMLTMSHYKYRQRLQWASTRYAGRHVLVTEEPGTSKTCTLCGHWHATLGSADVFQCPKCDLCIGRDLNGAIGNFYAAYGEAVGIGWDRRGG